MSMLLQKGGDFMALIKTPFKKKRSTIAGDEKRSQSLTPRSARGSTARSNSLGSSVNSYEGSEVFVNNMNESSKNIYADIDNADDGVECGFATNNIVVTPPDLPAENSTPKDKLKILQVPMISELENFEECVEADFDRMPNQFNCSKNNLLLIDDELMTGSIACHLNNIELVNKNLDRLIQAHHQIETSLIDDKCKAEAENKNLKEKIADKIKVLKYARIDSPGTSKGSFKSRVKNMFPKFERQGSGQDDQEGDKVKTKAGPIYDTPGPSTKKVDCSAENAGLSGENASSSGENASLGGENASSGGENADPSPGKAGKINDKLGDEKIKKFGKKFLSSFKRKQPSTDETDEVFEEIRKVSSDVLLTKLEEVARLRSAEEAENGDSKVHDNDKEGKLSSRFKSKFKSAKHLVTSKDNKIPLKVHHKTCRKCSKKSRFSSDGAKLHHSRMMLDFNVVDNELCVCVDVDDDFDDDGICIKNFEFKGVSFCIVAILA